MNLKKKSDRIFLLLSALLLIAVCIYGFILYKDSRDKSPVLVVPRDELVISVKDPTSSLLTGVSAYDDEDGDVTGDILIESISSFDENMKRTVTFVAFDSHYHVVRATRTFSYSDYESPKFNIDDSLSMVSWSNTDILSHVTASDLIDGDITANVAIVDHYLVDSYKGIYEVKLSVSNSAGDNVEISALLQLANVSRLMPVITLNEYLVYIDAGGSFDPMSYVASATSGNSSEAPEIKCSSDVDLSKPGCYSVTFTAVNSLGYEGSAFLTVIVK